MDSTRVERLRTIDLNNAVLWLRTIERLTRSSGLDLETERFPTERKMTESPDELSSHTDDTVVAWWKDHDD